QYNACEDNRPRAATRGHVLPGRPRRTKATVSREIDRRSVGRCRGTKPFGDLSERRGTCVLRIDGVKASKRVADSFLAEPFQEDDCSEIVSQRMTGHEHPSLDARHLCKSRNTKAGDFFRFEGFCPPKLTDPR